MIDVTATIADKRRALRAGLRSGDIQRYAGAFSPLVARAIEAAGLDGVYISGAALAADLGLPDIGLTSLTEVVMRGRQIARATNLPALIDVDTGFGEALNAARTVWEMEEAGLAGCHFEDQVTPKRCGHLDAKQVVSVPEMQARIRAAVEARRDPNFIICARTDARTVEGLDAALARAHAYLEAGADMIFPEALGDTAEFQEARAAIAAPILANMTEFGKSELIDAASLERLGVDMVIWPVTSLRLAMHAVEAGLAELAGEGIQTALLDRMQTRRRLYELVDYAGYARIDETVYDFALAGDRPRAAPESGER